MATLFDDRETSGSWHKLEAGYFFLPKSELPPNVMVLGGLGDGQTVVEQAVRYANVVEHEGSFPIKAAGLIIDYPKVENGDIEATVEYTLGELLVRSMREFYEISSKPEDATIDFAGISKSGGQILKAAHLQQTSGINLIGDIVLVDSLGPANSAFCDDPRGTFKNRWCAQDFALPPHLKSEFLGQLRKDYPFLFYALSQQNCREIMIGLLNNGHKIVQVTSKEDSFFRLSEVMASTGNIDHSNLYQQTVAGTHTGFSTLNGLNKMVRALLELRKIQETTQSF